MKYFLFALFFNVIFLSKGQIQESSFWYFGRGAGIKFQNGSAISNTNGVIDSFEGCSSVSDQNGNLLLYTNGETAWNKNHQILNNGQGLSGNNSASQSSIIVNHPSAPYLYYLFTIDATENQLANGLRYSVIDIREDNGLGKVISKNNLLIAPVSEKITITKHANRTDSWVIVHEWNTNTFHAFQLKSNGVDPQAIESSIGIAHSGGGGFMNLGNALGTMKASPKGNKIAVALNGSGLVELFDFNNSTGSLSNPSQKSIGSPYGIEFSPDESKLYISTFSSTIYQFEVERCSAVFLNNGIVIGSTTDIYLGSLQLGLDNKIYVARYKSGYLGVIDYPNEYGTASGFNPAGLYLEGKECSLGLPNFNTSMFGSSILEVKDICRENRAQLKAKANFTYDSIHWNLTHVISNNKIYLKGNDLALNEPQRGMYRANISIFSNGLQNNYCESFELAPLVTFSLPPDTLLCPDTSINLTVPEDIGTIQWQDGSSNSIYIANGDGVYWAEINNSACSFRDSITISYNILPKVDFPADTTICFSKILILNAPVDEASSFEWSDGSTKPEFVVKQAGTISLNIFRSHCKATYDINVSFEECHHEILIPNVITPNNDSFNDTFTIEGLDVHDWSLKIYNRWGNPVYFVVSYNNDWAAENLSGGIYFFVLAKQNGSRDKFNGWIQVIPADRP